MARSKGTMLTWPERAIAFVVGIPGVGGGAYAVFTSDNQAGTVALLLLSSAFLLIGIQGTPLVRFSSNSGSVELEKRQEFVDQAVGQARNERDYSVSKTIIDALATVEPVLTPAPDTVLAETYERQVEQALQRLGLSPQRQPADGALLVEHPSGKVVAEIAYRPADRQLTLHDFSRAETQRPRTDAGLLLVTNAALASEVFQHNKLDGVIAVTWTSEADDQKLAKAVESSARNAAA